MVIAKCGGETAFKMAVVEEILTSTMPTAMKRLADKEALVPGSESITSRAKDMAAQVDPSQAFSFDVECEVIPPLTWVKSYKDCQVTIKENGNLDSDRAAAEDLMLQYRKQKGGFQRVVVGRGMQKGDTCIMDLQIRYQASKQVLPGMDKKRMAFDSGVDPFNISEHLIGMLPGDTRSFTLQFPEDHPVDLWAGMSADASVKVHELFTWVLPELTDDYIKTNFSDFSGVEEMMKSLIASTAMKRVEAMDKELEDSVMAAVVQCVKVAEVPETLVQELGVRQFESQLFRMVEEGKASKEEVEGMATEEMKDEYVTSHRSELEDMIKFNMAVDDIWVAEGLTLDEKDVEAEVDVRVKQYKAADVEYDLQMLASDVRETLKSVHVIEWLKDNVAKTYA